MNGISAECDNFINYIRFERGLAEKTCDAYGKDLGDFADFLEKENITDAAQIR
ncbi:MAG: site-specific integrase, partial [Armatimonadetes bacterium]|nr:site-specific integrase [Candidatus Hippobium faecium]